MAGEASSDPPERRRRGGGFPRAEAASIRKAWISGALPRCSDCDLALDPQKVPPRPDVAYVRDRVLLVCRRCQRSLTVESRDRASRPSPPPDRKRRSGKGDRSGLARIGWREWVLVGDPAIGPIKAKIDTGARTSALHAEGMEPFDRVDPDGVSHPWIRFLVLVEQRSREGATWLEAPVIDHRNVRSSSGRAERRPVVLLPVKLGEVHIPVEVTLTRRDLMGFRMLVGRTALRDHFLVDPGASFLQGTPAATPSSRPSSPPPLPGASST